MTTAEIIAIGTELLLGDNIDTNTAFIARSLRDLGVNLYRTSIVGDNPGRISDVIREALSRADIVITTGGLGPTVDDPTREAVAIAFGKQLVFQETLWEEIQARFALLHRTATDNNRLQAFTPAGAVVVHNPVGTAPAFITEEGEKMVASLPGVPGEMEIILIESILPFIREKYQIRSVIRSCVIHCAGIGESMVDDMIADLEKLENPTVGLLAHPGIVDIRISAKAEDEKAADEMIAPIEAAIRQRLGIHIYGKNGVSLPSVVETLIQKKDIHLEVITIVPAAEQVKSFFPLELIPHLSFRVLDHLIPPGTEQQVFAGLATSKAVPVLGMVYRDSAQTKELSLFWHREDQNQAATRYFAGPPGAAESWGRNMLLDFIRRNLG